MLAVEIDQRAACDCGRARVPRVAPVDQEGDQPVEQWRPVADAEAPIEPRPIGQDAAQRADFADVVAGLAGSRDPLLDLRARLRAPVRHPPLARKMQPERQRTLVPGLLRVRPDDLQIRPVLQRQQVVVDAAPRKPPAQLRADARRLGDLRNGGLDILHGEHDVVDHAAPPPPV